MPFFINIKKSPYGDQFTRTLQNYLLTASLFFNDLTKLIVGYTASIIAGAIRINAWLHDIAAPTMANTINKVASVSKTTDIIFFLFIINFLLYEFHV